MLGTGLLWEFIRLSMVGMSLSTDWGRYGTEGGLSTDWGRKEGAGGGTNIEGVAE